MAIFAAKDIHDLPKEKRKIYAIYELLITLCEFLGAIAFIVGSFLFLDNATEMIGTWFFIIGSFFFALRPTLKFIREIRLYEKDQY